MKRKLKIYTDGSIQKVKGTDRNVGSLGFVAVKRNLATGLDLVMKESVEVVENTTITEMEIRAIRDGIEHVITEHGCSDLSIEVYSDSKTAVDAFNDYMPKWIKNAIRTNGEWRSTNGSPVAHQELYKEILAMTEGINVKYIHVKAHKESIWNNHVDSLVREAVKAHIEQITRLAA